MTFADGERRRIDLLAVDEVPEGTIRTRIGCFFMMASAIPEASA